MTDQTPTVADDRTILITRIFEAPREHVFAALTDPAQVAAWFGPAHVDTPADRVHIDLRVGGRYELTMIHRDSGAEHPLTYEVAELVPPALLILRCGPMPEIGLPDGTLTRIELQDHGTKTRLTLTDGPYPAPGRGGAEAGWNGALDKLAALLAG